MGSGFEDRSAPASEPQTVTSSQSWPFLARVRDGVRPALPWAALWVLTAFLYSKRLSPGVGTSDAGEFQAVPYLLGIPHASYPLYVGLGWIWSHALPVGSVAWRMNLLSAVLAAGSGVWLILGLRVLMRALEGDGRGEGIALLAMAAFALSPHVWRAALVAEVYALQLFLLTLFFWLFARFCLREEPGAKGAGWVMFVAGLNMAHHRTSWPIVLPAAAICIIISMKSMKKEPGAPDRVSGIGKTVLLPFVLPVLLHLYLPFRGWLAGGLEGAKEGLMLVLRGPADRFGLGLRPLWDTGGLFDATVAHLGYIGLVWLLVGVVALYFRSRKLLAVLGACVLVGIAPYYFFLANYGDMLYPYYVALGVLLAVGAYEAVGWLAGRFSARKVTPVAHVLLAIVPLSLLTGAWGASVAVREDAGLAGSLVEQMKGMKPGAVVFAGWDYATPLEYAAGVEGVRSDVIVLRRTSGEDAGEYRAAGHPTYFADMDNGRFLLKDRFVLEGCIEVSLTALDPPPAWDGTARISGVRFESAGGGCESAVLVVEVEGVRGGQVVAQFIEPENWKLMLEIGRNINTNINMDNVERETGVGEGDRLDVVMPLSSMGRMELEYRPTLHMRLLLLPVEGADFSDDDYLDYLLKLKPLNEG